MSRDQVAYFLVLHNLDSLAVDDGRRALVLCVFVGDVPMVISVVWVLVSIVLGCGFVVLGRRDWCSEVLCSAVVDGCLGRLVVVRGDGKWKRCCSILLMPFLVDS